MISQYLLNTSIGEGLITGKSSAQEGHGLRHNIQTSFGNIFSHTGIEIGFEQPQCPFLCEISKVKPKRRRTMTLVFGILTPIAHDDVQTTVTVQITGHNSIPPTGQVRKG